jgi:hypothetical protein
MSRRRTEISTRVTWSDLARIRSPLDTLMADAETDGV